MIPRSNSRARNWILCAASGLLIAAPAASQAQNPQATPQQALQSAVQRELDALYAQQGAEAPSLTQAAASQSVVATQQPQSLAQPRTTPVPPVPAQSNSTTTPLSRRLAGRASRARYEHDTYSGTRTQPGSVAAVQYQTSTPAQPQGNSAIMSELQKLYAQDGRPMPQMEVPTHQTPPPGIAQSAPQKKPNLLQRIFSFGRKKKPAPQPAPPQLNEQESMPVVRQGPAAFVPPAPTTPPAPVNIAPVQTVATPAPEIAAPIPAPTAAQPAEEPNPFALPEPVAEIATSEPAAANPVGDEFPDPFTEESETEADSEKEANPFTGLALDDAPAEDSPNVGNPIPMEEEAEVAESGEEIPTLELEPARVAESEAAAAEAEARASSAARKLARIAEREGMTGLKGFCSVALRDNRELVDTLPEYSSIHGLKTYYFSSAEAKSRFDAEPDKYAPAAEGYDLVQLVSSNEEVEGLLDFAAWYRGKLYLFSSAETKARFRANPEEFIEDPEVTEELSPFNIEE